MKLDKNTGRADLNRKIVAEIQRLTEPPTKKEPMSRRTKLHILGWFLITLAFISFIGVVVFGAIGIWNGDDRFGGIGVLLVLPAFVFGAIGGIAAAD